MKWEENLVIAKRQKRISSSRILKIFNTTLDSYHIKYLKLLCLIHEHDPQKTMSLYYKRE